MTKVKSRKPTSDSTSKTDSSKTSTTTDTSSTETTSTAVVSKPAAPPGSSRPWSSVQPPLSPAILKGIEKFGFAGMTPVQAAAIPSFLNYKDVCVQAVTGSGKTLAFVIPTLEILQSKAKKLLKHDIGAIILTPTRELSKQILQVITTFQPYIHKNIRITSCIGGKDIAADQEDLFTSGCNLLVATPGRLEWLLTSVNFINYKCLEVLILDEADRLLDMNYAITMERILKMLPKQRRTGLFSATLTQEVQDLAKTGLRNPVKISVKVQYKNQNNGVPGDASNTNESGETPAFQAIPTSLTNYYSLVEPQHKLYHLVDFLLKHQDKKVIVFFLTCADVDYFYRILASYPALAKVYNPHNIETLRAIGVDHLNSISEDKKTMLVPMHGQMPQNRRDTILNTFRDATYGALLCTDVAARGIDIPQVDWILQYDAPQNPDFFIHRIGRAARAGKQGNALLYLHKNEDAFLNFLEVQNVPIKELPPCEITPEMDAVVWKPLEEEYVKLDSVMNTNDEEEKENEEDEDEDLSDDEDEEEEEEAKDTTSDKNKTKDSTTTTTPNASEELAKNTKQGDLVKLPPLPEFPHLKTHKTSNLYLLQRLELKQRTDKKQMKLLQAKHKQEQARIQQKEREMKTLYKLPNNVQVRSLPKHDNIITHARYLNSYDRHCFNLSLNAYVSHIRAYKEHKCKYIFIFDDLPFHHIALGYGLLVLPQLPDLKRYTIEFPKMTRMNINDIPFQDIAREKNRLSLLAGKKAKNEEAKKQRLQREALQAKEKKFKQEQREKKKKTRMKRTHEEVVKEWEELAEEAKAIKKQKKGKHLDDDLDAPSKKKKKNKK